MTKEPIAVLGRLPTADGVLDLQDNRTQPFCRMPVDQTEGPARW